MKLSLKMPGKHAWRRFLSKAVFPLAAVLLILGVARWWKQPGPAATSPIAASQKDATPAAKAGLLAAEKAAASAPNSNQSKQALPPATPAIDEPESLWNAFSKARHEVQTLTEREAGLPQNRGVRYFAANPGQQLTARFLDQGVRIESGRGGGWQGTVQVTKLSRGGEPAVLPAAAAPTANGNRVEYQRGDVVEWYENRTEGIEHGFTVAKKPVANGPEDSPLQIDLNFGLKASMQAGGKAVQFEAAAGMPVMSYGDLRVWDARGTSVKAEMKVAGEGVSILVADAGAVYPLTIDPIIATLEQKLGPEVTGSGAAGDRFGTGVAVEGDTALIGVPGDDTAAGDNAGSAFVFLRTGSIWSQQARLTATDGTEDQSFGGAVSLSGNTAIVGALPAVQQPSANQEPPPVAGKAYVFVRSGTTWTQQAILTPGAESNMSFGNAVAVAGETALVGDAGANRVHVFLRTGTAWASQSVLVPVDGLPFDGFGAAVSLSGDTALIGAPFASESLPIVTSVLGASPEK
ncbi:MAG: FG-GAP repeat protein, partial [Prosthecobacter sp.]|nr:FG-GAP repeat protein [Prosthecobacter sp.]